MLRASDVAQDFALHHTWQSESRDYFRYAANIASPSAPADAAHSFAIVSPIFAIPDLSSGVGVSTVMPASLSALVFTVISSIDKFQSRSSAARAASLTAFFSAAERRSKAALLANTMLRGSHA